MATLRIAALRAQAGALPSNATLRIASLRARVGGGATLRIAGLRARVGSVLTGVSIGPDTTHDPAEVVRLDLNANEEPFDTVTMIQTSTLGGSAMLVPTVAILDTEEIATKYFIAPATLTGSTVFIKATGTKGSASVSVNTTKTIRPHAGMINSSNKGMELIIP